ncbi:hypothetical protein CWR45_11135 [Oceanobacillus chungangensis]|uniref:Uncharacterized protein n=1 Tax=Oceanobacillus chungangensis TaxID=1229152 RepID=A0A3D8PRT6_9BACI|nr:hypothetical protein CWR45_11135 [Oceanobacillus chungangensis]
MTSKCYSTRRLSSPRGKRSVFSERLAQEHMIQLVRNLYQLQLKINKLYKYNKPSENYLSKKQAFAIQMTKAD